MSRKSSYCSNYNKIAFNACYKNGADIKALAELFGVNPDTIYEWMKKYPDFKKAVNEGRDHFDSERVERRLVDLALGYEYEDTIAEKDSSGKTRLRKIKRQMPPNATAIIFYLKNRRPERWRDRVLENLSGGVDITVRLPNELMPNPNKNGME